MTAQINRRQFAYTTTTLAGAGFWLSAAANRSLGASPNGKVNVACIGVGGKGASDTDGAAKYGQVVALCDIDDQRLKQKAKLFPDAKLFHDYRELLNVMGDKIDAVTR